MSIYSLKKLFKESKTPRKFLWCCCSFLILILLLFFVCRFSSFTFSFRCHPLPFRELSPGFYTHLILSVQLIAERFLTFSYSNHSAIFWPRGLRHCMDLFYPQAFFTLRSLHRHLKPAFIKVSLGAGSSSLKFAGLRTDCRNTHPAHLFVWFTVIHNLHVQNDSVLNSTIYYHELLVVKVSFIYSLLVSNSFTCSKTYLKTIKKHFEQD